MLHLFALLYVLAAPGADADAILTPAQIADKVAPALVSIRADTPAGESAGSGFIVDPLGTVVTSLHVVEGATATRVKLASGLVYDHVRIRARDARTDLAILQLDAFGLPTVSLGDSDTVRAGDRVVVVSQPAGREGSIASGTVRRLRRTAAGLRMIETDAKADRGSSGGPLMTMDGRVVGVVSAKLKGRRGRLAIPINDVRRLISSAAARPQ